VIAVSHDWDGSLRRDRGLKMATDDSPSPEILYSHWQNEYQAAIVEDDPEKVAERVAAAETAIFKRLQQISLDSDHHTERHVIEDALASLRVLKMNGPDSPDRKKQ
jgi:hypothetical protein